MAWRTRRHLYAGEEVVVKSPAEILATLDTDGALDGLPFMPEMIPYCGRRFRVARRIEKTCVEDNWGGQKVFPGNDVVYLEELRCNGGEHDGCKRACMIFWKEAWLRRAVPNESPADIDEDDARRLRARLKVKRDATHYYCQSTQLQAATEYFPPHWKFRLIPRGIWVALREIWVGNRSGPEVLGLMWHWTKLSLRRRKIGDGVIWLRGPNRKTPTESLDLQPGERVKTKSEEEILATLDGNSKNRGLRISVAMTENCCGKEYVVRERMDRMIMETTGEMREITNTVSLEGLECLCAYQFLSCPRGELQYWREIWLERVDGEDTDTDA